MTTFDTRGWSARKLTAALDAIPGLLTGPSTPTPEFEDWVADVRRGLEVGLGEQHVFTRDFAELTMVHRGSMGTRGQPDSWQTHEVRTPTHEVLRRTTTILRDAVELLGGVPTPPAPAPRPRGSRPDPAVVADGATEPVDGPRAADGAHTAPSADRPPTAMVSYAWSTDEHHDWVRDELAGRLRTSGGVETRLDMWNVRPGHELTAFMERAVRESDFVLAVCDTVYRAKTDERKGGVGYEARLLTGESLRAAETGKIIPILRGPEEMSIPAWLVGIAWIDLRGEPGGTRYEAEFQRLINTLHGYHEEPPPVASKPPRPVPRGRRGRGGEAEAAAPARRPPTPGSSAPEPAGASAAAPEEPIRLLGVATEEVGRPRSDGTPGSALYRVPIRLSRAPSYAWVELFVQVWDRPPRWTSMHRPGIASVSGDMIILDGTTLDEVQRVHRDTLKLVVETVNERMAAEEERSRQAAAALAQREARHRAEVDRLAREITFD